MARPTPAAEDDPRRQHALPRRRRRRRTTPSGASTSARSAASRCCGKLRKVLGARARAASTARSRSAPAPATSRSTCCRPASIDARDLHRHLAGHARRAARQRRAARARRRDAPSPTPSSCRSPTSSFDLVLGHAVLHHLPDLDARVRASSAACCSPGGVLVFAGEPSRHGDRLAQRPQARPRCASRRCGGGLMRARPAGALGNGHGGARPHEDHALEHVRRRPRVHARRPRRRRARAPASTTCACAARSCWPTGSAGPTARSSRRPTPRRSRGPGASTPTAATSRCRRVDERAARAALPAAIFYNLLLGARSRDAARRAVASTGRGRSAAVRCRRR